MANPHVEQVRQIGVELQRAYMWDIIIAAIPVPTPDARQFTFRAMSTSLPDKAIESYDHNFKSTKTMHPGRDASAKSFDLTFIDGEDLAIYRTFHLWVDAALRLPKNLITTAVVMNLLSRDDEVRMVLTLQDCYPENLQAVTLEYGGSDPINVPVTLRYDDSELL